MLRVSDAPQPLVQFVGLADIEDVHRAEMFGDPLRVDLEQSRIALAHRSPVGGARHLGVIGLARAHVGGHGDGNLPGVGKAQVFHEADEVAFVGLAADARVVRPLLADRGDGAAAVVVPGENQAVVGQAEYLPGDRAEERGGIALLEIATAGAADQQAVAGEGQAMVVGHVGQAAVGVPWGGAHFQGTLPEGDSVAMIEPQIGPLQVIAIAPGDPDLAAGGQSHQRGAGHMIGMAVRVEGGNQLEPELLDQCAVAQVLLVDRVDDHGLAALRVGQQVGIGR